MFQVLERLNHWPKQAQILMDTNEVNSNNNWLLPQNTQAPDLEVQDQFPLLERTSLVEDLQQLEHLQLSSSSTPQLLGFQTPNCYDHYYPPFASNFHNQTTTTTNNDLDFLECKPFGDPNIMSNSSAGYGQVMDNFIFLGFHNRMMSSSMDDHDNIMMYLDYNTPNLGFHDQEYNNKHGLNLMVPDEVSSVDHNVMMARSNNNLRKCPHVGDDLKYKNNSSTNYIVMKGSSSSSSSRKDKRGRKKSSVIKGQWTIEEDRVLIQLVEQHGIRKWSHIAQMLPGRIGKQCRERWHNHLRPDIKFQKDCWKEEEDRVLIEAHAEIGNKWAEIAKRLPGRTENSIKNHWNATKRRQYSKRKCRSKYPRGTLLQDYIKSLNNGAVVVPSMMMMMMNKNNVNHDQYSNCNTTTVVFDSSCGSSEQQQLGMLGADDDDDDDDHNDDLDQLDRLVPDLEFNHLDFNDNDDQLMLQGNCTIQSLLDEFPGADDHLQLATDHHRGQDHWTQQTTL